MTTQQAKQRQLILGCTLAGLLWSAAIIWGPFLDNPLLQSLLVAAGWLCILLLSFRKLSRQLKNKASDLQAKIDRLNLALNAANEAVWEWHLNSEQRRISFSEAYCKMLGYDPSSFASSQKEWQDYLHPIERERIFQKVMKFISAAEPCVYESTYRMRHSDDSYRWIHSRGRLHFDQQGKPVAFIGIATDITDKRLDADRLQQAHAVFESTHEGVLISDHNNAILFVNPAFTQITGYTLDEIAGKNPSIFQSGRHNKEFYTEMWRSLEQTGKWSGEIWNRRKNGETLPQFQTIRLIRDENGLTSYNVAVFTDISILKRSQSELSFLAHYDPLTNLPNRLQMHQHIKLALSRAMQNKTQAALFIIDLDHFKNVNESLGHSLGDELLKATAERLTQFLANNTSLSRFSGDEFAVVFEDIRSAEEAANLAQQLLVLFDSAFHVENNELFVTASIGICLFPSSGQSAEDVLRHADSALSKAKTMGRATFAFYTTELTDQAYHRLRMVSELRSALENDHLKLFFQPVFSCKKQRIVGCESLARWQHPERGMISPMEFIPIAEDSGLIGAVDTWALEESCKQMKLWLDAGLDLRFIAVNVSSKLFNHSNFIQRIQNALHASQLEPKYLELEITESAVLENPEQATHLLNSLRSMGIRLALDDFGTGYSSLSRLKSLPVQKLKIDQSFVRNLPSDYCEAAIVRAIIVLGNSMKLEVQAEGIETEEQAAFLMENDCSLGQGYFYGRPMPAHALEALITQ